jgi:hypothetical protein
MAQDEYSENVNYVINEMMAAGPDLDLYTFLTDFEKIDVPQLHAEPSGDYFLAQMSQYDLNYTLKQLGMIYEYYNIGKTTKLKKADIIQAIVVFEHDIENCEVVMRRQQLWHYLEELKSDKFMKRFVLST